MRPSWASLADGVQLFRGTVDPGSDGRRAIDFAALRVRWGDGSLEAVVTGPEPGSTPGDGRTAGASVSAFLVANDCVAAVNATPFDPSSAVEGEERRLVGLSVSSGVLVSPPDDRYAALLLYRDLAAVVAQDGAMTLSGVEAAVGGFFIVLKDGRPVGDGERRYTRSAVGVAADGRTLYILAVEGRFPFRRMGATELETGSLLAALGASEGLILDGGGSSALAVADGNGGAELLNVPTHDLLGNERVVGNCLGFRLSRSPSGPMGPTDPSEEEE